MAEEESEEKEYRWETGYEKTWEAIKEDDHGLLEASVADIIHNAKRKRQLERKQGARLGMMRHLYIILDASEPMTNQDLKPTRFLCSLKIYICGKCNQTFCLDCEIFIHKILHICPDCTINPAT